MGMPSSAVPWTREMVLDARMVERWGPSDERPAIVDDVLTWEPVPGIAPLELKLPELFAEVPDLI